MFSSGCRQGACVTVSELFYALSFLQYKKRVNKSHLTNPAHTHPLTCRTLFHDLNRLDSMKLLGFKNCRWGTQFIHVWSNQCFNERTLIFYRRLIVNRMPTINIFLILNLNCELPIQICPPFCSVFIELKSNLSR